MSHIVINTSSSSAVSYSDIWDISIDPHAITGASYFSQEAQRARVTLPYNATIAAIIAAGPIDGIYRARVDIWEEYVAIDADGEQQQIEDCLFWGYLFADSITIDTVGVVGETNHKIVTLELYDHLAVLAHSMDDVSLTEGDEIIIDDKMQELWMITTGDDYPLWGVPPLVFDYTPYSDYSFFTYTLYIYDSPTGFDVTYARIYAVGSDLLFDVLRVDDYGTYGYIGYYERYRLIGTGITQIYSNSGYAENFAALITALGAPTDYASWSTDYHFYEVPATGVTYQIVQEDVEHQVRLLVTGTLASGVLNVVQDQVVSGLDLFNYMLSAQFVWLHRVGGTYVVSNKQHHPNAEAVGFTDAVKVTQYKEEFDTRVETFDKNYTFINLGESLTGIINDYAEDYLERYPRVCSFSTNEKVELGDFVMLPRHNTGLIHIVEVDYDMETPQLFHYKGRSA